jgi:hypothetical protein
VEQLAILALALVFGLVGLAIHVLWFAAIVLMALLLGLMASELRGRRDGGVISEVATAVREEAKKVAADVTGDGDAARNETG